MIDAVCSHVGPKNPLSEQVHAEKYREPGEDFVSAMKRISNHLCDFESHRAHLEDILLHQRFLPAGRIQSACGSPRNVTAFNCFVSGKIEDSFVEGSSSIMGSASKAATTMRMGGGIGYSFGGLRPKNSMIKKLRSGSSGPVSFMHIYDAVCRATSSAGNRRGAQMGVMPVWHPSIEEFVDSKKPPESAKPILDKVEEFREKAAKDPAYEGEFWAWMNALQATFRLTGFNISVGITDEFMTALKSDGLFKLRFDGDPSQNRDIRAVDLWEKIMRNSWEWAEPGVLFLDTINNMNNLRYCEVIEASNPCGEQPLPPNGACLLGSWNLTRYVRQSGHVRYIDLQALEDDVATVVRAMDNVIDRTSYPLRDQEIEALDKRRMGLGVTGLANAIEACGHPYGSKEFVEL